MNASRPCENRLVYESPNASRDTNKLPQHEPSEKLILVRMKRDSHTRKWGIDFVPLEFSRPITLDSYCDTNDGLGENLVVPGTKIHHQLGVRFLSPTTGPPSVQNSIANSECDTLFPGDLVILVNEKLIASHIDSENKYTDVIQLMRNALELRFVVLRHRDFVATISNMKSLDENLFVSSFKTAWESILLPTLTKKVPSSRTKRSSTFVKRRITKEEKAACYAFFDTQKFNRNTTLSTTGPAGMILNEFIANSKLSRNQIKTQLANWKNDKYLHFGEVFRKDPEQIRMLVQSHMSKEQATFMNDVLDEMMSITNGNTRNLGWFNQGAHAKSWYNEILPKMKNDPFKSIFFGILDMYIDIATEVFPETAKECKIADGY